MKTILVLFLLILLQSCVGTVQNAATGSNLQNPSKIEYFNFPGLTTARPIAHDKIELEFFPADSDNVTYKLQVNNSTSPFVLDMSSVYSTLGGKYLYTVTGLNTNQQYKFKLMAEDTKLNMKSSGENELYATTYDNRVAQFHGVSKVSLVPGQSDNSILVDWIAPGMEGTFTGGSYDPAYYEVTLISEIGGAANLNNSNYGGTDRRVVYVPTPPVRATPLSNPSQTMITSLPSNTRYYVQVRAINTLWQNFYEDPSVTTIPVSRESNTKFLTIKTDPSTGQFTFNQDNVVLSNALGADAFDKINVFWQAGSGTFNFYRVYVRKYDGAGDATQDDKMTEAVMVNMTTALNYVQVPSTDTSRRVTGLDNGGWYQVKVALCKTPACPIQQADPNAAIISNMKAIKVQPTLAAFTGINALEPPGQYNATDVVNLRFDAPVVSAGYADTLEFYCVNPADKTQMVKFNGTTAISGSPIAVCNGLNLVAPLPTDLSTYTQQKVKGLVTTGAVQYCFAATPAITSVTPNLRQTNMVIRCSFPTISPPTLAQFPGVRNAGTTAACSLSGSYGTVQWNLPTGGIYSGFQVYWKEKDPSNKFSYQNGIDGLAGYSKTAYLPANQTSYQITNFMPGRTYEIGVLAIVDLPNPSQDLYSEFNLNVAECVVPLPIASFKGFTRIFAIGPRTDGRYPNTTDAQGRKIFPQEAKLYEAINSVGIPYEVPYNTTRSAPESTAGFFQTPPGRDVGTVFASPFDGIPDPGTNLAMSNSGIVSLAWEEVAMNYATADTIFQSYMPASVQPRAGRTWGYKIYRSSDNKLTWQEISATNGPIYSMTYGYTLRTGTNAPATRMAFFTDYSVSALYERHDSTNGRDIERARVYYYKIIPVFDGKPLTFSNTNRNIVKVTLPPPNMALVHRWMANRGRCLEMDKTFDINNNYRCNYNGVGAVGKSIPYRINDTALDQGGDLLVDRNELGCRYTRGDKVADPTAGQSIFKLDSPVKGSGDDPTIFPSFAGYSAASGTNPNTGVIFKGCTGRYLLSKGSTQTAADYTGGFSADYQHLLQGDCIGPHNDIVTFKACSAAQYANGPVNRSVTVPGAYTGTGALRDCSDPDQDQDPTYMWTRYFDLRGPNFIAQSEFLGVFYNTYMQGIQSYDSPAPTPGPTDTALDDTREMSDVSTGANAIRGSQCSINLAAVDGSGYMYPRWVGVNSMLPGRIKFKDNTKNLANLTVAQITEIDSSLNPANLTFYNGSGDSASNPTAIWRTPKAELRSSDRFYDTTRISRIFSSNAAKLPPLGRTHVNMANAICSDYWVEVGSANGNEPSSIIFSAESIPIQKRLLRRQEFVTAAAWPENSTTYTSAYINTLENSNNVGSCSSSAKANSGIALLKGSLLTNPSVYNKPGAGGITKIHMLSGSSAYQYSSNYTDATHTALCQSKYGIQDLVGNVSEINIDKIFCDYSQDAIYMGQTTTGWFPNSIENVGAGNPKAGVWNTNDEKYNTIVIKSGNVNGVAREFEIRYNDGSATILGAKPYANISVDSGYCALTDKLPSNRNPGVNPFTDVLGNWYSILLPGGAINTAVIPYQQLDIFTVNNWRNGDGRFGDFGPRGIFTAINRNNTLSLSTSGVTSTVYTAKSKYFNPVVGLPLMCNAGACADPKLSPTLTNDNTNITLSTLATNILSSDNSPSITNFPVGNSQVTNSGVSEYISNTVDGFDSMVVPEPGSNPTGISRLILSATFDNPVNNQFLGFETATFPDDLNPGDTLDYYKVTWSVDRGADFIILSGGAAQDTKAGRFTANIDWSDVGTSNALIRGLTEQTRGFRCSALINQD